MERQENLEHRWTNSAAPDPVKFSNMTPQELATALARARPGSTNWHLLIAEQRRRERWPALIISMLALIVSVFALAATFHVAD
jgi:hypothetical protein